MNKQNNLALMADCKRKIKHVDEFQVRQCSEMADALRLAWEHSTIDFSQAALGRELGLGNGNSLKAMMKPVRDTHRPRYFDINRVNDFTDLVGNDVLPQWLRLKVERQLLCDLPEEERNEEIKAHIHQSYIQQSFQMA